MRHVTSAVALLLLVCMATVPALAGAPGIAWQKSFGGSGDDSAVSLQPTNDGGYIAIGETTSTDRDITFWYGMIDVWIYKVDSRGE